MSSFSLPVTRPSGRALIVGNPAGRSELMDAMQRLGYGTAELDDPYAAMAELCRRPLVYRAVVLSLGGLYREELDVIDGIKHRFPHVDVWLSHTDGRQAALADAMRHGADGLLSEDGLHRISLGPHPAAANAGSSASAVSSSAAEVASEDENEDDPHIIPRGGPQLDDMDPLSGDEPVLSADELRALLQEQPALPPGEDE